MDSKKVEVIFEFLIFGIIIGITEDILAVKFAAGGEITWRAIGIIILIAIPFAVLGELIADRIDFVDIYRKIFKKRNSFDKH